MQTFKQFFRNHYDEDENVAGDGGVFGVFGANSWNAAGTHTDYATGDTRIPKIIGRKHKKSRKHGKKSKKSTKFEYFKR